jgi:hypothetical protein
MNADPLPDPGARVLWLAAALTGREGPSQLSGDSGISKMPLGPTSDLSGAALTGREGSNQLSGDSGVSKMSLGPISDLSVVRDLSFNPDISHARSHLGSRSKAALIGGLVCASVAVALTAVIVIGQFTLADIWRQFVIDRTFELASFSSLPTPATSAVLTEPSTSRLVVETARGASGQPAPLGLTVQGRAEGAVVHIRGLMPGMELSMGSAVGPDAWEIPVGDLGYTSIAAPEGFVGSTDLVAELRLPDDKIADRQALHVEWVPLVSPVLAQRQLDREEITAAPAVSPVLAQRQLDREEITAAPAVSPVLAQRQLDREEITSAPAVSPVLAQRQLDREEITDLINRGKDLIANGDLAAARLVLKRAADANNAEAALVLAATYDPAVLRELKVYGFTADAAMARAWYQRARELGSAAALQRLDMLTSGAR